MTPIVPIARSRQRGVALVLFTIGTLAIVAVAGLALDMGLAYLARSRLQNALDAAALSGAKTLNIYSSSSMAVDAANAAYALNQAGLVDSVTPVVELSPTLSPFNPGGLNPRFVRVTVSEMPSPLNFARVLPGMGEFINVGGVAVAGPIPLAEICGAIPLALCGEDTDPDCSDGACFGLGPGRMEVKGVDPPGKLGPGNYGLVVLGGPGGSRVRENMAGGAEYCFDPEGTVTTEPGRKSGPTAAGLNTRFGMYRGGMSSSDYPPDVVTRYLPPLTYTLYQVALGTPAGWDHPPPEGVPERRVAVSPIIDCDPPLNGRKSADVMGAACLFLTEPVDGGNGTVYAEIAPRCMADGRIAETPGESSAYTIVLYQNVP